VAEAGWPVVVTGAPSEGETTARIAAAAGAGAHAGVHDLGGRTSFASLAAVLARAACVVVGNTGPAHLAAAVGTPVVSLFAPVVDAEAWRPWGVPSVVLGDQWAPCAGTRVRTCPVPGHPCLGSIEPEKVLRAIDRLAGRTSLPTPVRTAEGVRIA
jgi:ADP-heptose:LPS heptosyltransferase